MNTVRGICRFCHKTFVLRELQLGIARYWRCHWCGYDHSQDEAQDAMVKLDRRRFADAETRAHKQREKCFSGETYAA